MYVKNVHTFTSYTYISIYTCVYIYTYIDIYTSIYIMYSNSIIISLLLTIWEQAENSLPHYPKHSNLPNQGHLPTQPLYKPLSQEISDNTILLSKTQILFNFAHCPSDDSSFLLVQDGIQEILVFSCHVSLVSSNLCTIPHSFPVFHIFNRQCKVCSSAAQYGSH